MQEVSGPITWDMDAIRNATGWVGPEWEYRALAFVPSVGWVDEENHLIGDGIGIKAILNEFGHKGWEMCGCNENEIYLKRQLRH